MLIRRKCFDWFTSSVEVLKEDVREKTWQHVRQTLVQVVDDFAGQTDERGNWEAFVDFTNDSVSKGRFFFFFKF